VKQITEQLPTLQAEVDFLAIQHLSREEVLSEARDIYSRWPSLEGEEKREIIENTVGRIVIGKEDVTIELAYLPNSSELMARGHATSRIRVFSGAPPAEVTEF
jgi:site-specific DNA recombinase